MADGKKMHEFLHAEVAKHNYSVNMAVDEYEEYDYLATNRALLKRSRIRPRSEMVGEGLRETYVAIGHDWFEGTYINRWKDDNEYTIKEVKYGKIRQFAVITVVSLIIICNIVFYSYALYDGIVPAFGETMKRVHSGDLKYDDLSRFTKSIFFEIKSKDSGGNYSFLNNNVPPEIKAAWESNLCKFRHVAGCPCIEKILIDSDREGIYYVQCESELPDLGSVEFRLQCSKIDDKYVLLALE